MKKMIAGLGLLTFVILIVSMSGEIRQSGKIFDLKNLKEDSKSQVQGFGSPTPSIYGYFGLSVGAVPDVNGDGRADIAVLEPNFPNDNGSCGRVHIYSGAGGKFLRSLLPVAWGTFQAALVFQSSSVSGVPDVNGDGRGDILITAPGHDPASSLPESSGMAYLYSGATGALLRQFVSPNKEANGWFGFSASGVQDVTGDGRGDIVIGAVYETAGGLSDAGRAYIFSGATGTLFKTLVSPSKEGGGNFGFGVAGLPSTVKKAKGYVLVGAPYEDPGSIPSDCGRAYIFKY